MQMSSTTRAGHIEISEIRRLPIDEVDRLALPAGNAHLFSTQARNLPRDRFLPPLPSKLQGDSVIDGQAAAQDQRGNEVIVAIAIKEKGELGCAYYNSDEGNLLLLQDMPFAEPLQLVETILVHVQPTIVLVPLKTPDAVLRFLEQRKSTVGQGSETERYILRLIGSNEFNCAASLDKLASLPLIYPEHALVTAAGNRISHDDSWEECQTFRIMRLGSFIDLDSIMSIGCAGAVICETIRLQNMKQGLGGPEVSFIATIRMFTLADFMLINADTLSSLQVFQSELHPNSLLSGAGIAATGLKEGLSLYGLFHPLAGTPQGRAKLRQLFLRPLVNVDIIRERHNTISVLLQSGNKTALEKISQTLKKVMDIKKTLAQLQRGAESPANSVSVEHGVWWTLTRFSLFVLRLRDAVLELQEWDSVAIFRQIIEATPVAIIKNIGKLVGSTVDFEEAKASSRIAVKWNVNPKLDKLKQTYHGLEAFLSEVSTSLTRELPEWARKYVNGCVFWPQLGFLTVVPLLPGTGEAGYEGQGLDDDCWEQRFIANGNVYYKNKSMLHLDAQIGDTYSRIVDLEVEILHNLACQVLKCASTLSRASEACGELDCLVALAKGALKYGWTCPRMTTDNVVSIQEGRHPLQELTVPAFIPNDCRLVGGSGNELDSQTVSSANKSLEVTMLVVTGPNHSGKSVYIKQVALIVYLAHIGSFVPADGATIGITDRILTRISTRESMSLAESSFGTDLRQVSFLMECTTRRTLVAIDEFGKGTATDDGSGLMTALIEHFTTLNSETPKVLITTHCHEIFEAGFLEGRPEMCLAHMNVRLDLEAKDMEDQVVFLYQLVLGRSMSSFGSRCAAMNGVEAAVVERAEAITLLMVRNEDLGAAYAKLDVQDEARLEEAENVARGFLQLSIEHQRVTQPRHGTNDTDEPIRTSLSRLLKLDVGS